MTMSNTTFDQIERHTSALLASILLLILVPTHAAKIEHLIFRADCQLTSDPFPVVSPCEFEAFWSKDSTRNLLLSAGGRRKCRSIEPCAHTSDLWVQACHEKYGLDLLPREYPADTDYPDDESIMATDTDVKFPGFQIHNTVLNGCKLHMDEDGRPSYTFCLIGDHKAIQGNPSVTWLVRKLTGMSSLPESNNKIRFEASETVAKTQVRIIPVEGDEMKLQINVQFATHIRFPKALLRILPSSKENVEQKGSRSIIKVVEKDAKDALNAVREAWMSVRDADTAMIGEDELTVPIQIPIENRLQSFKQRFVGDRVR